MNSPTKRDPRFWTAVWADPELAEKAEALARSIATDGTAPAHIVALARNVAEAQVDHDRVCQARDQLVKDLSGTDVRGLPPSFANLVVAAKLKPRNAAAQTILAIDRSERHAVSRRYKATNAFDAAIRREEASRVRRRDDRCKMDMELPEPPSEVAANPVAARKWRDAWSRLDKRRYNHQCDHDNLASYCLAYADWVRALGMIDPEARVNETRDLDGGLVENPYVKMAEDAREKMRRYGQQIGLSPPASVSIPSDKIVPALTPVKDKQIIELKGGAPRADQPCKPGRRPFWTEERVRPALQEACGIFADAARILSDAYGRPCARQTLSALVRGSPELQKVCEEAHAAILDDCYAGRVAKARAGNDHAQEYLLNHLDSRFKAKHEVSGPGGRPIQVQVREIEEERPGDHVFDGIIEEQLTDDERVELARIAKQTDAVGSPFNLPMTVLARFKELQAKASVKPQQQIEGNNDAAA